MAVPAGKLTGCPRGGDREPRAGKPVSARRVVLESITARLLWDGRPEDGRFIPGIAHFQSGVMALRRTGDAEAVRRLAEIDAALSEAEDAVGRWARGLALFARDALSGAPVERPGWTDVGERRLRIRAGEAVRLATLICAFDAACAATAAVTAAARERHVFNPHHANIAERARMIRRVADLGYSGGLACREKDRARQVRRPRRRMGRVGVDERGKRRD